MKTQTSSRTAERMAICRAVEHSSRPPARRILSDPWALRLIPSRFWRTLASSPLASRLMSAAYDFWIPGAQEYALIRARLVDDFTRDAARDGLQQLVILGAGFDTTIFRLQESLSGVAVFEVDHPATQAVKTARLASTTIPGRVKFVPVDFEKENWVQKLLAAGFQRGQRSLVSWLGVSYYLTESAVAGTLRQVAELMAPGDCFIFDYVPEAVIAGTVDNPVARVGFRHAARMGEPFLCGLDPCRLDEYLARFGFKVTSHYNWRTLQERYGQPGRKPPVDFSYIAFCERV